MQQECWAQQTQPQFPADPVCVPRQVTTRLSDIHTLPMRRMYGNGARFLQENYSSWIQRHGGYVRENITSCLKSSKRALRWAAFIPTCPSFWQEEAFHSDDEDEEDQWAEKKVKVAQRRHLLPCAETCPLVLWDATQLKFISLFARASCYDTSASHERGVWTWNEQNRTQDVVYFLSSVYMHIVTIALICVSQLIVSDRLQEHLFYWAAC